MGKTIAIVGRACCTPEAEACVCAPQTVLAQLARPYALVVVSLLSRHEKLRFGELEKRVQGASAKALVTRLRELEHVGFVRRFPVRGAPRGVAYSLTSYGEAVYDALRPALALTAQPSGELENRRPRPGAQR